MAKLAGGRGLHIIGRPFHFSGFIKTRSVIIPYGIAAADECIVFAFNHSLRIGKKEKCFGNRFFGAHGFKCFFGCAYFDNALLAQVFGLCLACVDAQQQERKKKIAHDSLCLTYQFTTFFFPVTSLCKFCCMRYLSAKAVFSSHTGFVPHGVLVLDDDGVVHDLLQPSEADTLGVKPKLFDGVLCPGFVNAHCHLELSHLRGEISKHTGFAGFAKELIPKRNLLGIAEIEQAATEACETLFRNGTQAVGDIANTTQSFAAKAGSRMHIHTFIELLALNPSLADKVLENGKALLAQCLQPASLAPHAPYSVSEALLQRIAVSDHTLPFSIHNQESRAENEFFEIGTGRVNELYEFLGIDISWFTPPGCNALRRTLPHLLAQRPLLLVHNTFTSTEDLQWAETQHSNLHWCFCPNANLYIENTLPDFMQFYSQGVRCCVGTDSLASNHGLSILEELKVIAAHAPGIPADTLLRWATAGGAAALNMNSIGSFERGKKPGVIQLQGVDAEAGIAQTAAVTRIY
jgi:aminodeoxyfutalosine deaminase